MLLQDVLPGAIARAWRTAVEGLRAYGGTGDVYMWLMLDRRPLSEGKLEGIVSVGRWTELREPTEEEIASVDREVRRAFGQMVLEAE